LTNRKSCIIFAVATDDKLLNENIMATINLTKGGFLRRISDIESNPNEWKFLGNRPAWIDFFAPWCGPGKSLSPVLEELSEEYAGKVDIYKVNVDDEEALAEHFGIRSIPTLYFIPMEGEPRRAMGALPKSQLKEMLDSLIK
jgi:thioredoxin